MSLLIALLAACPAALVCASDDGGAEGAVLAPEENAAQAAPALYEIESAEVPLAALPSMKTWAFANLCIAVLCFVASAVTIVTLPLTKQRRARSGIPDECNDYRVCIERDRLIFKLLGAGVGAASVVLLLLTENLRGAMLPANGYTWLMSLILLVQLAILFMAFKGEEWLCGPDALPDLRL
ncbi:MAG: hypothetical protein LBP73_05265 [Clostridiales Family XIII bacterium]|nr:hypothetical protein [Clostridiales Family XIII bacterium]